MPEGSWLALREQLKEEGKCDVEKGEARSKIERKLTRGSKSMENHLRVI